MFGNAAVEVVWLQQLVKDLFASPLVSVPTPWSNKVYALANCL